MYTLRMPIEMPCAAFGPENDKGLTYLLPRIKLDWPFGFMKYGGRWKERRKLFQQHFHPQNTESYQPKELEHVHKLLKRLHDSPEKFIEHIRQYVCSPRLHSFLLLFGRLTSVSAVSVIGALTITIAYGLDIKPSKDPYIEYAEKGVAAIAAAAAPGAFLVDAIPLLKYVPSWFPGAGFKRKAHEWRKWTRAMVEVPFRDAEKAVVSGLPRPGERKHSEHTKIRQKARQTQPRSSRHVSVTSTRREMWKSRNVS